MAHFIFNDGLESSHPIDSDVAKKLASANVKQFACGKCSGKRHHANGETCDECQGTGCTKQLLGKLIVTK